MFDFCFILISFECIKQPIRERIQFRIAILTYNAINHQQPHNLSALLTPVAAARTLRSIDQRFSWRHRVVRRAIIL